MAETFVTSELVIPGTYIRVEPGPVGVGAISFGNVGIVGTVAKGFDGVSHLFSEFAAKGEGSAGEQFGDYDALVNGQSKFALMRGLELLYRTGASTTFALGLQLGANDAQPGQNDYIAAFKELLKEDVNILVAPQLSTDDAKAVFGTILEEAENSGKDVIAVIGTDKAKNADIKAQVPQNGRIVFTAPGVRAFDSATKTAVDLPGTFAAAAVAGLLATLSPQSSPTNKVVPGLVKLTKRFSFGEIKDLVANRVLVLEERQGVRVVRGITSDGAAFPQITKRRITDFAKAGIRKASNPFIGRLNNQRVRKALFSAIDGFLTTMKQDEALIDYQLNVTATRDDEINGRALVNAVLQPTYSIDFVAVSMVLE